MMKRILCCLGIAGVVMTLAGGALPVALAQSKDGIPEPLSLQQDADLKRGQDQIPVFLISFAASDTVSAPNVNQQATVLSLTHVGGDASCRVWVEWRLGSSTLACTTTSMLEGGSAENKFVGSSRDHCTRALPDAIVDCNEVCEPGLESYEGKAIVSTTAPCLDRIAVDARLYHTTGENDQQVTGIADVKVIRLFTGNLGD